MQWTIILEATTGWGERTCTPVYTFGRPVLDQILHGLHWSYPLEIEAWEETVARAKWRLWHGQLDRADQALGKLAADLDPRLGPATPPWSSPLLRLRSAVGEVQAYLRANASSLVDYARRYLLRPAHLHRRGRIDG